MKFGDPIILTKDGKDLNGVVLGVRYLDHHHGKNDEPVLHIGTFEHVTNQQGEPLNVVGTARMGELAKFYVDVVHESHEFTADQHEQAKQRNMSHPSIYPGPRWKHVDKPVEAPTPASPLSGSPGPVSTGGSIQ